jgi:glycine cleavage system aminomethyltransferase T
MHRARLSGPGAAALLRHLTPRPMSDLAPGRIRYALRLDAAGHAVADLTVWRLAEGGFEVFSGRPNEIVLLRGLAAQDAVVDDLSAETTIFAVQGPESLLRLAGLASIERLRRLAYFDFATTEIAGVSCRVGRLGYTGERGFEIVAPRTAASRLWAALAERIPPAGFAAADILRIEAGFVLFSNELAVGATPEELGLGQFSGAAGPPPRARLIAFTAEADVDPLLLAAPGPSCFPPAPGTLLVTSACRSSVAGGLLGLGYVASSGAGPLVDPSGRFRAIREVRLPCVDPEKRRPRGAWRDDLRPDETVGTRTGEG